MSRTLAVTRADGRQTETAFTGERLRVVAEGGASYRLVDRDDPALSARATVRRVDDDLVIKLLDDGTEVVIAQWFFVCDVDYRGCTIELEPFGGKPGETVQPGSTSTAGVAGDSGLIWSSPSQPTASADSVQRATTSVDPNALGSVPSDYSDSAWLFKPALAGVAGLLVVGAAVGGGSDGDATGPAAVGDDGAVTPGVRSASVTGASSNASAPSAVPGSPALPTGGIGPGPLANGGRSNDTSPQLTGTLDAPLAEGERVQVLRDGAIVGEATVSALTWSFTDSAVPAGDHRYSAQVVSASGDISAPGTPWILSIDGTAPAAPRIDAVTGDNLISSTELSAGIAVTGSAEAGATITLRWGDLQQSSVADADGRYAFSLPPGASGLPGDTTIAVIASDSFGNQSTLTEQTVGFAAATVVITGGIDDEARITGPFASGARINDDTPTIIGRLGQSLAAGETVQILRNGTVVGQATVDGLQWRYDDDALRDGTWSFTARVVGRDGTVSASSAQPFTFVIDSSSPDTPSIDTVAGNNRISAREAAAGVAVTGEADAGTTIEVSWGTVTLTTIADGDGDWSVRFDDLPVGAGTSAISVAAVDAAGNASAIRTRAVTVDAAAFETTLTSADLLDENSATIVGLATDGTSSTAGATSDPVATIASVVPAGSTSAPQYVDQPVTAPVSLGHLLFDPIAQQGGPSGGY